MRVEVGHPRQGAEGGPLAAVVSQFLEEDVDDVRKLLLGLRRLPRLFIEPGGGLHVERAQPDELSHPPLVDRFAA
jgi:hypothetical protein